MGERSLARELHDAFGNLSKRKQHRYATESARGEAGVLNYLTFQEDGVSAGQLKEKINVGSGRMADILKSLESKSLIRRNTNTEDYRKVIVSITEEGKRTAEERRKTVQKGYEGLIEYLGTEETQELIRLLKRVDEYDELNNPE